MKSKTILVLVAMSLWLSTAHANQWCYGQVKAMYVTKAGDVMVHTSFNPTWLQICNLQSVWKGVALESCRSWHALALTLRITQEPAGLHYADATACEALPNYGGSPAPTAFMVVTPS